MTAKKLIGQVHLWLGLASGLVVMVVALTGAIWAFESELSDWLYDYRTVAPQTRPRLSSSALKIMAQPYFKGQTISSVELPAPGRAAMLRSWGTLPNGDDYHTTAYQNPYTGQVLHVETGHTFFDIVLELHVNLLLGEPGRYVVDFSTLFFLILLISGIVLWWPKNRAAARQRFWFNWKQGVKWRRQNYDLHNILGFYASWVVIFVAITGLTWGFEWMDRAIYATTTLGADYKPWADPKSSSDTLQPARADLTDYVVQQAIRAYGRPYKSISVYQPDSKTGAVACYVYPSRQTYYDGASFFFDQRTGQAISEERFEQMNSGQQVRSMYYDIHIGKILGLPGQFLVCFASLIVASLPVTGFIIWLGRRKKARKGLVTPSIRSQTIHRPTLTNGYASRINET